MSDNLRRDASSEGDEDGDVFDELDSQSSDDDCEAKVSLKEETENKDGNDNKDEILSDDKVATLTTWEMMKKDPTFVPRASRYFLHDDRGGSESENRTEENEKEIIPKAIQIRTGRSKKLWVSKGEDNEWKHDKFEEITEETKNEQKLGRDAYNFRSSSRGWGRGRGISRRNGTRATGAGRRRGGGIRTNQGKFEEQFRNEGKVYKGSEAESEKRILSSPSNYSTEVSTKIKEIDDTQGFGNPRGNRNRGRVSQSRFPRRKQANIRYVVKQIVAT